jgi:hypothetical protein
MSKTSKKPGSSKNSRSIQFKKTAIASSLGLCLATLGVPSIAIAQTNDISGYSIFINKDGISEIFSNGTLLPSDAVNGIALNNELGISITSQKEVNSTVTGGSQTTATSGAYITGNSITNNGTISTSGEDGIFISSFAEADSTITGGDTEMLTTSEAKIWGSNDIINNGTMSVSGGYGILLLVEADADSTISGSASADITGDVDALAVISNNFITNNGFIYVDGEDGISLQSHARADLLDETLGANATINGATNALSIISGNQLINNKDIFVIQGNGISLYADASISGDGDSISGASAIITGNQIINKGSIVAGWNGISLITPSFSGPGEDISEITKNIITNNYGGRIISRGAGIYISGDTVDGNEINISGLVVADTGLTVEGGSYTKSNRDSFEVGRAIEIYGQATIEPIVIDPSGNSTIGGFSNTLEISAPAYLAGEILLDSSANVNVNLTSGPSHSVLWSIAYGEDGGASISQNLRTLDNTYSAISGEDTYALLKGAVPWFVSEDVEIGSVGNSIIDGYDIYATIDPSAFAAAPNMLGDLSSMVSGMAKTGLSKSGQRRGVWLALQGGERTYEGDASATMDQKTKLSGVAVGYSHEISENWNVSGLIGGNDARLDVGSFYSDIYPNSYKNKADGGYIGLYFGGTVGPVAMSIGVSGGMQSHKDRRFVNDNLKWWGISHADSKYDSTWYSPEISFAIPIKWDSGWSVTPSLSWRYSGQDIDGYTETGLGLIGTGDVNPNAKIASRTLGVNEANLGIDVTRAYGAGSSISGRLGYLYRASTGDKKVRVEMIGDEVDVPFFFRDLSAGTAGINWKQNITGGISFYLNANYIKGNNVEGGDVATGLKVDF